MNSVYFRIFCWVYKAGGRSILRQYVNDPHRSWDETAMSMLDKVTGYNESDELETTGPK
jgi:hypothetical protein